MQKLIELYEMVSINEAALRGSENAALLKARLALNMFEQAMQALKTASAGAQAVGASFPIAA
jgi:hypothetical protein